MKITQTDFGVSISTDGPATIDLKITPVAVVASAPTPDPVLATATPPPPAPLPTGPVPALIQGYKLSADGVYESIDGWQKDIANVAFVVAGVGYGKTMTIEVDRSANYDPTNRNVKRWRGWRDEHMPGVAAGACNTYVGHNVDGWKVTYTEGVGQPASQQTSRYSFANPVMRRERLVVTFPTAVGKADGRIQTFINGVLEDDHQNWQFDTADRPGLPTFWCIQDDYSPNAGDAGPFPADAWVKCRPVSITVK